MFTDDYDYLFKLLLIGDSGVGKSSIMMRFTDEIFTESHISTIGVDFKITNIRLDDGKLAKLQIWDTAGQERFRNITTSYYRGAHGIILVFDLTNRESFENIKSWLFEVNKYSRNPVLLLVGNKSDLPNKRKVESSEIEELKNELEMDYVGTSAKTNLNIGKLFRLMSNKIKIVTIERDYLLKHQAEQNIKLEGSEVNSCC